MSDLGPFACLACAGPLRYAITGLKCITGVVPAPVDCPTGLRPGIDCTGLRLTEPTKVRPRTVEVFVCSCGCKRTVKVRPGDERPERVCERGGILIFDRVQSR